MNWTLLVGLVITAAALAVAGRRVLFLYRLVANGQPAPDRVGILKERTGQALKAQLVEVLGQRKLLKWTVPGVAHFFIFWAFLILASVYVEAYGALFDPSFAIPLIGRWEVLGFLQDLVCILGMLSLATFAYLRLKNSPKRLGTKSRFAGSHLGGAWVTLLMIFNVLWTMLLFRGAAYNTGHLPYDSGAFASIGVANLLEPLGEGANEVLEHVGLLLHIGVMLVFLIIVVHSKHLHIFTAPVNVSLGRKPVALGAVKPLMVNGEPFDIEKLDELDEEAPLGVGKVEDFSWKADLDFLTCTECGRCQSQCPAWNTEKPLSPKMVILNLRDHALAKAPYTLASSDEERERLPAAVLTEAERPLVGKTEGLAWHPEGGAVIDDDVLWSCTTCGACVNQCPVDIEHVDHIVDMRRYQVLIESSFPSELNGLFKALENKGNPWSMSQNARMEWAKDLDFEVKQVGVDVESLDEVEWLFWVGCAGAYEDRAKKTTAAVAELFHIAGVDFAVLGDGETCTGDPARRAGNEFVFQQLAMQNAEVLKESNATKVVSTCAHCFNTLRNEYSQFGVELEVVHHTQLLNRLVREGRLTPVAPNGGPTTSVTYHDPCYLGRHNAVYEPPRELLSVLPSVEVKEMERARERSFCCGAGGARMWMEERIGERINMNRTAEAVATGADQVAIGCPFCQVMIADGLTALKDEGKAREEVEVLDVAQMLLASVRRAPVEVADGEDGNAAAVTEFPLTVTHDGTVDPEQAPDRLGDAPEVTDPVEPDPEPVAEPVAEPVSEPLAEPIAEPVAEPVSEPVAEPVSEPLVPPAPEPAGSPAGAAASKVAAAGAAVAGVAGTVASAAVEAAVGALVEAVVGDGTGSPQKLLLRLPDGQRTAAETWSGQQVESILEGDEVDISEFKAKLKAELKAELLAEVRAELEGALNSDSGASAPVSAETVSSAPPEPDTAPDTAPDTEPEPPAAPAAEPPAAEPSAAEPSAAEKPEEKKDGGEPPLLIGSL